MQVFIQNPNLMKILRKCYLQMIGPMKFEEGLRSWEYVRGQEGAISGHNIVKRGCGAPGILFRCFELVSLLENSLARSKPATRLTQAHQHTVWNISTISKPYWAAFYRYKMSTTRCEWVRLFISWQVQSAYNSVRSRCWEITTLM